MSSDTYLFVGLGNPGSKYHGTRHNIGFTVADALADANGTSADLQKWDGLTAKIMLDGSTIHVVKPMTYMNLSGRAVAKFVDFYRIPLDRVIVVHDDLDMHLGRLKLVAGGGTGGHNGIRSLVDCIGGKDFYRLKIGIGRPGSGDVHADIPVERFVLTSFQDEEAEIIEKRMADIIKGLDLFFEGDARAAMNYLNRFK